MISVAFFGGFGNESPSSTDKQGGEQGHVSDDSTSTIS